MKRAVMVLVVTVLIGACVACSPRIESIETLPEISADMLSSPADLDLPKEVTIRYNDGNTAAAAVTWDTSDLPEMLRTDIEITGRVKGTDLPARLQLAVNPDRSGRPWFEPANPGEMAEGTGLDEVIAEIIGGYFQLRENSVVSATSTASARERDSLKAQLSGRLSSQLLVDEDARQQGHARAAANAGIAVARSSTALHFEHVVVDTARAQLRVYELTRGDYRSADELEAEPTDAFRFGLWHDMYFDRQDEQWTLVRDDYEEPDIRGTR